MKRLYLFGNHKMNLTQVELNEYFAQLRDIAEKTNNIVGVGVSAPYMYLAKQYLDDSKVLYGPQTCHYKEKGAYTGENSIKMLQDFNCNICIIGHSERRAYYNENDAEINLKLKELLKAGITPVFCFGETLEQREADEQYMVIENQIVNGLDGIEDVSKIIFAYEPVWAIGTGKSATSDQAEDIAKFVKELLNKKYNIAEKDIVLLYGGSLNAENGRELLSKQHIDGGLIGGACLKIETFEKIINIEVE